MCLHKILAYQIFTFSNRFPNHPLRSMTLEQRFKYHREYFVEYSHNYVKNHLNKRNSTHTIINSTTKLAERTLIAKSVSNIGHLTFISSEDLDCVFCTFKEIDGVASILINSSYNSGELDSSPEAQAQIVNALKDYGVYLHMQESTSIEA